MRFKRPYSKNPLYSHKWLEVEAIIFISPYRGQLFSTGYIRLRACFFVGSLLKYKFILPVHFMQNIFIFLIFSINPINNFHPVIFIWTIFHKNPFLVNNLTFSAAPKIIPFLTSSCQICSCADVGGRSLVNEAWNKKLHLGYFAWFIV